MMVCQLKNISSKLNFMILLSVILIKLSCIHGMERNLTPLQEQNLYKLNIKCGDTYCLGETINDLKYGYRAKLRCLKMQHFQFLRYLPFDESYLYDNSTWTMLRNCIYSVPEQSLVAKNVSLVTTRTNKETQTVCPWDWTDDIPERSQFSFPPKRMFAKCKCHFCKHIGNMGSGSACKPVYTLKPMLLKMNDGRWRFFMERVSTACACKKNGY